MKQNHEQVPCTQPELGELFISYLGGHVTADERGRVESHLLECTECQEELRFFKILKEVQKEKSAANANALSKRQS